MSKADVLAALAEGGSDLFVIDPFVAFTAREWEAGPSRVLEAISEAALGPMVVVRSSADTEALDQTSPPGAFRSELGVEVTNTSVLSRSIEGVLHSIRRTIPSAKSGALVQTQVLDVAVAGVVTTLDLDGVPYLTVEYDTSGRTDRVTSGYSVRRAMLTPSRPHGERWATLVAAVAEVRRLFHASDLVVEFAIGGDGRVHVFQAWDRGRTPKVSEHDLLVAVDRAQRDLDRLRGRQGVGLVLSDMTDWNPAEMLGRRPGRLDVSLYRRLITDDVWSKARSRLGYYDCPGPLLVEINGQPYVDVVQSFRSLTPASLSHGTREAHVDGLRTWLASSPATHDKVEHDLLTTYWPLGSRAREVRRRMPWLPPAQAAEYADALRVTTAVLLREWSDVLRWAERAAERLAAWRRANSESRVEAMSWQELLSFVGSGLRACKRYGTLPFAAVARLAFVADGLARDLATLGYLDADRRCLWARVRTPAEQLAEDLVDGSLSVEDITELYGHLRPHSYNIESTTYGEQPGFLASLRESVVVAPALATDNTETKPAAAALERYFRRLGVELPSDSVGLLAVTFSSREFHKFRFTAVLSDILEALAELGRRAGVSRSEMRSLTVSETLRGIDWSDSDSVHATLRRALVRADQQRTVQWPDLIAPEFSFDVVEFIEARPTFISGRVVDAEIWRLTGVPDHPTTLDGRLVVVEAADPGFDWIFTRPIAGLVTCYGGSTSHMAIRCHELAIPAAIGCGPALFEGLEHGARAVLDCRHGSIVRVGLP